VTVSPLGEDAWHVVAVVENLGFLPTHVSAQALRMKAVQPVRLELAPGDGVALAGGKPRQDVGQLQGRSNKLEVAYNGASPTDNRARAEWVVRGPAGATVELQATSERAGVLRRTIVFGD